MLLGIVEVEIHLTGVGMRKFTSFEVNQNQAFKDTVIKQKIDAIPFGSDTKTFLASNKSETVPQLEQKPFKMTNQRILKL
jgi:hypothetical protein